MLKIMKASAGSGKTYNLAKTYISLLLKNDDRYAYKHILAVTFTNKATEEMKSRILKELHTLAATPDKSPYLKDFIKSMGKSKEELSAKAQSVLRDILHDYSAFAVSTIDKFFQQTLRAFAREIGQFASYQVELDKDSLIAESVDRVLDSLSSGNLGILPWLSENVIDQLEQGGRYSLEGNLVKSAGRLRSTQRQEMLKKLNLPASIDKNTLRDIRNACRDIIRNFNKDLKDNACQALGILSAAGISTKDSNRGFMSHLYNYENLGPVHKAEAPSDSFMDKASNYEAWFAQSKRKTHLERVYPALEEPLESIVALWKKDAKLYNTAHIIDSQIYGLGIAEELSNAFEELLREKNVMCLDDSNTILRNIIDRSDAPFIYEKLGVRFDHFLLDEFQDTSSVQWENFFPLVDNSDSQGGENLIVGDVKQSIYRWRESDWELLNDKVPAQFEDHVQETLQTNYRSLSEVVGFNNVFFKVAARILDKISGHAKAVGPVGRIYSDVRQSVAPGKEKGGCVCMSFCPKGGQLELVHQAVLKAMEAGARMSEIAILVRSNDNADKIALHLIQNGISVITEKSLKAKSSLTVRRVVSLMSYVNNPEDTVNSYLARSLDVQVPDSTMSLTDMAESLIRSLQKADVNGLWRGEALHIQTFMDTLTEYVASNGNNLHGFLKHWEKKDPSISSVPSSDSVKIMTIHKSKGLDFPYVIIPFAETISLFKDANQWCVPDLSGTALENLAEGVYDVRISGATEATMFSEEYRREKFLQQVDNINTLYVAMTRASLGNHIIANLPSKASKTAFDQMDLTKFGNFAQMLYWFAQKTGMSRSEEGETVSFVRGEMPDFAKYRKEDTSDVMPLVVKEGQEYPSVPLNIGNEDADADVCVRGRLKFTADALDFFRDDESAVSSSRRVRGVILHDILSRVVVPEDLDKSVQRAVLDGEIGSEDQSEVADVLGRAIKAGSARGWFPSDKGCVLNEVSLMDVGGQEYRPDRVLLHGGKAVVIDYKFGEHQKKYERQVRQYAQLWKKMGYSEIKAFIWYVETDQVVEVI